MAATSTGNFMSHPWFHRTCANYRAAPHGIHDLQTCQGALPSVMALSDVLDLPYRGLARVNRVPMQWRYPQRAGCIAIAWIAIAASATASTSAAQDPRPAEAEQRPKPGAPLPTPVPPEAPRGLGDLLGSQTASQPTGTNTPVPTPENALDDGSAAARLDSQIRTLREKLDSQRSVTVANITPLPSLDLIRERAREQRVLVDRMRKRIYLPDPKPDAPIIGRLTALESRWGDLVRPIAVGLLPAAPVSPERWSAYAQAMSRLHCDSRRVRLEAPSNGMPLGGWEWACLSDVFFHELAEVEASVDHLLTTRRIAVTATLEQLMSAAEDRIARAPSELAVHPSPKLLLRELTWALHQVEVEGARLRIRELEYQKAAGDGTPAFRRLLELSANVHRPAGGSARTISVTSGAKITAKLGDATADAAVRESELARLARELRDAHFRLERLRIEGQDPAGAARLGVESERARVLGEMAIEARSLEQD